MTEKERQEAIEMIEKEHLELADKLERVQYNLERFIRCLRREEEDMTGVGIERIFLQSLEIVLNVKVISCVE